jgi:hypothetical protein
MLSLTDLRERLKYQPKKNRIKKAVEHELRLRFHSEIFFEQDWGNDLNRAVTLFCDYIDATLSKEKALLHKKFLRFPVETLPLVSEIRGDIDNIFDGQDPIFDYRFSDESYLTDWLDFQANDLREMLTLRNEGLEHMLGRVNSMVVVDAPSVQVTDKPMPYFYFQPISGVIDYECDARGDLMWVVTMQMQLNAEKQPEYFITVFDDASYRRFQVTDAAYTQLKSDKPTVEAAHSFGYCPVEWFWNDSLTSGDMDMKRSPLSEYISMLDKLLLKQKSKDVLDHTASNPIIWFYKADCDYENPETGATCSDGYLKSKENTYIVSRNDGNHGGLTICPRCHESRFPGAGSYISVPAPEEDSTVNMRDPAGFISVDRNILDYSTEQLYKLSQEIYQGVTGNIFEVIDKQAINEEQVRSFFEARKKVLFSIKRNFEHLQTWLDKTLCKMRYGDAFKGVTINYGTEFFLFSPEEALETYEEARSAKLSATILDELYDQYIITKYRHNRDKLAQVRLSTALDPFHHSTNDEILMLYQQNLVEYKDMMLKYNLSSYISRFERENTALHQFGLALPFNQRVDKIKQTMLGYIKQPAPKPIDQPAAAAAQNNVPDGGR